MGLFVCSHERSFLNLNYPACHLGCLQDQSNQLLSCPIAYITQSIKHNLNWRERQKEREDETGSAHPQPSVWIFLFWSSLASFLPTSCLGGSNRRFFRVEVAPSPPCFLIIPSYTWCFRTGWSIRQARPWEPHCTAATGSPPVSSLLCWMDGTGWKVRWACWPCLEPHVCLQLSTWDSDQERELHKQVSLCTQFTQRAQGQLDLPLLLPYCVNPGQQHTVHSWVSVLQAPGLCGPELFSRFLWSSSASSNDFNPLWLLGCLGGTTAHSYSKWLLC